MFTPTTPPEEQPTQAADPRPTTNASENIDDLLSELNIPRQDTNPRGFTRPGDDPQPTGSGMPQPQFEPTEPVYTIDEYKLQAAAYVRTFDMGAGQFLKVYSKDKGNQVFNATDTEQQFVADPLARVLQKHNVGTLPPELELIIRAGAVYFPRYQEAAELRKINILSNKVDEINNRLQALEKAERRAKLELEKIEMQKEEKLKTDEQNIKPTE